jgi:hypothetical protein
MPEPDGRHVEVLGMLTEIETPDIEVTTMVLSWDPRAGNVGFTIAPLAMIADADGVTPELLSHMAVLDLGGLLALRTLVGEAVEKATSWGEEHP